MAIQVSPGVVVSEIDLTTVVPAVSTSDGGFVGGFQWGPANTRISVSSENDLVNRFYRPDSNTYLSFFTAANFLSYGNNLRVVRQVGSGANNASAGSGVNKIENDTVWFTSYSSGVNTWGHFAARYPGDIGNSLRVSFCPSAEAFSQTAAFLLKANTSTTTNAIHLWSQNAAGVVFPGDQVRINSGSWLLVDGLAANGNVIYCRTNADVTATQSNLSRKWGYSDYFQSAPGTSSYAALTGAANDEIHVVVVDEDGKFSPSTGRGTVLETFGFLSKASDAKNGDGTGSYYKDAIFSRSKYVHWMSHPAGGTNWGNAAGTTTFTHVQSPQYLSLVGGQTDSPTDADILRGLDLFANKEEVDISLLLTGSASLTVATYAISVAEARTDCVAFISPRQADVVGQSGSEVTNIIAYRNQLPSSSYTFMDSNWKYMLDKYNNAYRWVPLNADVAGCAVRTDTQRDPWFSIAGPNRGQIKNSIKLAWNPTPANRDDIYKIGVNPVVTFPGQGTMLYGDKTLQSKPSSFDRINVRRLFIVLEKAISSAAKYSLFEFNDEFTRAQFINLVEPFLRDIQGRRGIYDFRVVCDETNNTPEVIDTNRFVGDIYIKPTRSINFIQLNFVAVATGVSFTEKAGAF